MADETTDNQGQQQQAPEGQQDSPEGQQQADQAQPIADYEAWFKSQPKPVQDAITGHITKLRSALDSERAERSNLAKQIKELLPKADKGSELEKQLQGFQANLETAERRADFYEAAGPAGVSNLKLAWITAQADDLITNHTDSKGRVNFERLFGDLKERYPELFAQKRAPVPPGNAGSGAGAPPATEAADMNRLIVRAARGR
jgi:hypothetical protein